MLVLIFIAVSVFVATQKGEFDITRTKIIKSPRNVVFNYVNDYRNWEDWASWSDSGTEYNYPAFTSGMGGSYSWDGSETDGEARTVFVKENDSILQKMEWNGLPADSYWTFKDTTGGTKVTWRVKGKMGFMPKIYAALKGGPEHVMGTIYENSLAALDKTLDYEINTYTIKVDGIVNKPGSRYLYQSITSTIDNMPKNMRIMMSKVIYFFKKNKIPMNGKPFVMFDTYDKTRGITKFSVCVPIRDEIFTSAGSDISFGKFDTFRAVKTTLNGDYSHLREAWDKTFAYIEKNKLKESDGGAYLESYKTGRDDVKGPSKFVTEIFVPVDSPEEIPASVVSQPVTRPEAESPVGEIAIP